MKVEEVEEVEEVEAWGRRRRRVLVTVESQVMMLL